MCRKEMFDNQRPVKCSDRQGKGLVQIKSVRIFKELIRNSRHKNFIRFQPLHPLSENQVFNPRKSLNFSYEIKNLRKPRRWMFCTEKDLSEEKWSPNKSLHGSSERKKIWEKLLTCLFTYVACETDRSFCLSVYRSACSTKSCDKLI